MWVMIDLIALLPQQPARAGTASIVTSLRHPYTYRQEKHEKNIKYIKILTEKTSAMVRFEMMDSVRSSTIRDYIASFCWTLKRRSTTIFSSSTSIAVCAVEHRLLVGSSFTHTVHGKVERRVSGVPWTSRV